VSCSRTTPSTIYNKESFVMQHFPKRLFIAVVLVGLVLTLGACGNGGSDSTSPAIDVTGQWTVTTNWQNPVVFTDTVTWVINADGTFEDRTDPGGQVFYGTWTLQDTSITLTYNTGGAVYNGTVDAAGASMQGTMQGANNSSGTWTAVRS
jgi:hypothetical protein